MITALAAVGGATLTALWPERRAAATRARIPHRLLIGGGRGKSTLTRLLHAALQAGGLRCLARVTGDDPLAVLPDGSTHLYRRPGSASIRELVHLLAEAGEFLPIDVLAVENMAVRPELQRVVGREIIHPTMALFVANTRDHLDHHPVDPVRRALMLLDAVPRTCLCLVPDSDRSYHASAKETGHAMESVSPISGHDPKAPVTPHMQALAALALGAASIIQPEAAAAHRDAVLPLSCRLEKVPTAIVGDATWVDLLSVNDPESTMWWIERATEEFGEAPRLLYNHRRERAPRLVDHVAILRRHETLITGDQPPLPLLSATGGRYVSLREVFTSRDPRLTLMIGNSGGQGRILRDWFRDRRERGEW